MTDVEHQRGYYDSAYLAEYYESLWTEHPLLDDVEVYWRYLKSVVLSKPRSDEPVILLDVGTGTGRVLRSLIARSDHEPAISCVTKRFIGMDVSPHMLARARNATDVPSDADVYWLEGTATALQALGPFAISSMKVDLLIFAFSGINHLHQSNELDQFFASVNEVLRPDGLALVSVCNPLLDVQGTTIFNPYGKVKEVKSKNLQGILYREQATGQKIDQDIFINSLRTEVVQVDAYGNEQVVERNHHHVPLKLLTRDGLYSTIAKAGLRFLREEELTDETIFVLEKASTSDKH